MNLKRFAIVLAATLAVSLCRAQTAPGGIKEDFQASALNQPGQNYPQVNSQGYVRFRIKAPKADSIRVILYFRWHSP